MFAAVLATGPSCTEPSRPPNVLLLVMDTTRADRCSLDGYHRPTTPALSALAREGTVYTDAWAPSSWTAPSHASLFTGLRPEHHGLKADIRLFLDEATETLAERLAARGYATACLANNPMVSPSMGLVQGFSVYEMFDPARHPRRPSARWTTDRALELATQYFEEGRPAFIFVNDWEPHLPYDPPDEFTGRFLDDEADAGAVAALRDFMPGQREFLDRIWLRLKTEQWRILSDLYDAEVATLDSEIGRLVAGLRDAGLLDDTVVVIVSDHGENLGDHGLCGHVFSLHRSLLHVPLLIRFPERFEAGRRVDDVVRLEDLFPTILELCGAPVPSGIDGVSLLKPTEGRIARAVLGGQVDDEVRRDFPEFVRSGIWQPRRSVYDGRWHLIVRGDGRDELYDVAADPREVRNLIDGAPEALRRLHSMLPESGAR